MTEADKTVLRSMVLMLAVIYLPGIFYSFLFSEAFKEYYSNFNGVALTALPIIALFFVLYFCIYFVFSNFPRLKIVKLSHVFAVWLFFLLAAVYFISSAYFFMAFDVSFRHSSRLAEGGVLVALMFFLKPLVYIYILFYIVSILNGARRGPISKCTLFLIFCGSILSINSALQIVFIFILLAIIFAPRFLSLSLFKLGFRRLFLIFMLGPLLCVSVVVMGVGNKVGFDFLISHQGVEYLKGYVGVLFSRMSTSLMSLVIISQNFFFDPQLSLSSLSSFYSTFTNRLSIIVPGFFSFDYSLIDTVNRMNYVEVFASHAQRAGASPGIISSIYFFPIYPLGFLFVPMFLVLISRLISYHLNDSAEVSLFGMFCIPYLVLGVFEAPLNIIYVFDPVFVIPLGLLFFRFVNVNAMYGR